MNIQLQYNLFYIPLRCHWQSFLFFRTFIVVVLRRNFILWTSNCCNIQCITKMLLHHLYRKLTINNSQYFLSNKIFRHTLALSFLWTISVSIDMHCSSRKKRGKQLHGTVDNHQPTQGTMLIIIYIITLNIATCFSRQGITTRDVISNNIA
jgi:hypothetical protein